jgi:hypothetical protein
MKTIPLSQGKEALIDDADYAQVSAHKWFYHSTGYAVRMSRADGKSVMRRMHRDILDAPKGFDVDHIDGNGLNNQRANLRVCTHQQNTSNQRKRRPRRTGTMRGAFWFPTKNKWRAAIGYKMKYVHIGYYNTEIEAAKAYDEAARRYFGEYAVTNYP